MYLLIFLAFIVLLLPSCKPHPLQAELELKNPNCQVICIKGKGRSQVEASLQCGPVVKTVTYRVR